MGRHRIVRRAQRFSQLTYRHAFISDALQEAQGAKARYLRHGRHGLCGSLNIHVSRLGDKCPPVHWLRNYTANQLLTAL